MFITQNNAYVIKPFCYHILVFLVTIDLCIASFSQKNWSPSTIHSSCCKYYSVLSDDFLRVDTWPCCQKISILVDHDFNCQQELLCSISPKLHSHLGVKQCPVLQQFKGQLHFLNLKQVAKAIIVQSSLQGWLRLHMQPHCQSASCSSKVFSLISSNMCPSLCRDSQETSAFNTLSQNRHFINDYGSHAGRTVLVFSL
jgi:hypothetical protein